MEKGIPQEKAIEMFNLMVSLGADLRIKNYFEKNIFDWANESVYEKSLTNYRINNEKFKKEVMKIYINLYLNEN